MFTSIKKVSIILALILALAVSFVFVSPVHAESVSPTDPTGTEIVGTEESVEATETPVLTATPEATGTPTPEATLEEIGTEDVTDPAQISETPTVEPTETEEPVMIETSEATEDPLSTETVMATEDPAAEDATAEALDELAENDIQLVDGSGEELVLATEETSELIANGDPYFIVDGVTYRFAADCTGLENCTESATPIQAAIDYMETNNLAPTDGKLYIEAGTYTEEVIVDGAKNGVSGLNGIVGNGATPADVLINGSITLQNIENGFSISNLTVTNTSDNKAKAIDATENISGTIVISNVVATESGRNGIGIKIKTEGDVYLDNVDASGSGYLGCGISASGSITVVNSVFTNNGNNYLVSAAIEWYDWYSGGLTLHSSTGSSITVDGVTASGNYGFGANIGFPDIQKAKGIITIQNSEFNDNTFLIVGSVVPGNSAVGDGLQVDGVVIVLVNIEANGNSQHGIDLFAYTSFTGSE